MESEGGFYFVTRFGSSYFVSWSMHLCSLLEDFITVACLGVQYVETSHGL